MGHPDRQASLGAEARGVVHVNEAGIQGWGLALCVLGQEEQKQHYWRTWENPFSDFRWGFPKCCSSINQAGALSVPFSSFQREMVCQRVIPQHGFISSSCWDVLARSSPLVYWLQTICDCRGLWLLSLQKQEMQSIHERHRTFFFSFEKCIFISASISGDQDLKELFEKNLSLSVLLHRPFQIRTLRQTSVNLALSLWVWKK